MINQTERLLSRMHKVTAGRLIECAVLRAKCSKVVRLSVTDSVVTAVFSRFLHIVVTTTNLDFGGRFT